MRTCFVFFLQMYQWFLSPYFGHACRFYPRCSQFAIEAIEYHGCLKGCLYTLRRLACCHPWHPGGFDPVVHKNPIK